MWSADGLVIRGADTTVEHVEFSGGRVPDKNGADPQSDVLVEHSEFHHNGAGDGYSHNLYIGQVRSFTLRFCSSHHERTGHLVKSRAQASSILYNRLMDEALQGQNSGGQKDNSGRQRQGSKPNGAEPSLDGRHGSGCG